MKKVLLLIFISFFSFGEPQIESDGYWSAPPPIFSQQFDWLKLKSGEWFKGDIISMYDDELEFESDEFDNLTFDWEDVEELRSRFDQQIRFDNGEVRQGFLVVKNNHVILISNGAEEHFPLSQLLSITSSADKRLSLWDGSISLGVDLKAGNVNQLDYIANFQVQRRTPYSRFNVNFIYNYSKSTINDESNVITDNSRLTSYFDWFYSSHLFFRVLDYEYYQDVQQNIQLRHTLGASAGYHIVQNKRLEWDVTIGPSYQTTAYYDLEKEEYNQDSLVLALRTEFDYSFSSKIDYIFDYQLQFVESNSGKRNSYLKTGLELEVGHDFDLDVLFYVDRVAEPVAVVNDVKPKSNDYRLVVSIGYDF